MSAFNDLIGVADNIVLEHFGDRLRWIRSSADPLDIDGILDLEYEHAGPNRFGRASNDVVQQIKAVTVKSGVLTGFKSGEALQVLNDDGKPTGVEYLLQDTLEDDGGLHVVRLLS
ncbi:MAG: hypothetical protein LBE21_04870 [Pseudomonadales bacterium]|jgi:hypothetical protein|nr:hypothetical protein [Pseudomonadales bacterium]